MSFGIASSGYHCNKWIVSLVKAGVSLYFKTCPLTVSSGACNFVSGWFLFIFSISYMILWTCIFFHASFPFLFNFSKRYFYVFHQSWAMGWYFRRLKKNFFWADIIHVLISWKLHMVLYFLTLNIICKSYYLLLHSLSNHYPILLKEEQSHPDSTFLKACLFCCLDRLCFFKYAVWQPFPYPATSDLFLCVMWWTERE